MICAEVRQPSLIRPVVHMRRAFGDGADSDQIVIGHGSEVRRGVVRQVDPAGPTGGHELDACAGALVDDAQSAARIRSPLDCAGDRVNLGGEEREPG
jgi:hypothetical protein